MQNLIEMFGSKIEIESELGKGCRFTFTIKFKNSYDNLTKLVSNNLDHHLLNTINVLLIEDNKINQLITLKSLKKLNCNVEIVENGLDALELLKKSTYDLIITDITLPDISGFEIIKIFRQVNTATPVFALTAYSYEEIKLQAIESGIDEIFVKPFKIQELAAKINENVRKIKEN